MTFSSPLRNFTKFTGKYRCQSLLFDKVAGLRPVSFIQKETLAQLFSREFCEISKNTFSYRTSPLAASVFCWVERVKFHTSRIWQFRNINVKWQIWKSEITRLATNLLPVGQQKMLISIFYKTAFLGFHWKTR